ncbi:fluoride efflux transporter FluC [Sunxiuqinia indica]|uniref:fluoride efflux transporter FluC n=1 Tax=Sunxiuqinia indica TaxID=2692584 RepID=UPI001358900F
MFANVAGCVLIGLVYAFSERGNLLVPEWCLFMTVGFCGAFTTFPAFAYNSLSMLSENNLLQLLRNISLNVIVGTGAVYIGIVAIRFIYS